LREEDDKRKGGKKSRKHMPRMGGEGGSLGSDDPHRWKEDPTGRRGAKVS